jgi:hypothetical protein
MTADAREDRFELIGQPQGSTADTLSSSSIGTPTTPPPDQLLDFYPLAGGVPAPIPAGPP